MEAIDVHFHIVPPRFVDLVRSGELDEIVDVGRAGDVDRLLFRPPPDVAIEPDTSIRPYLNDARLILAALDRCGLDARRGREDAGAAARAGVRGGSAAVGVEAGRA